jgi:hypothetical protein
VVEYYLSTLSLSIFRHFSWLPIPFWARFLPQAAHPPNRLPPLRLTNLPRPQLNSPSSNLSPILLLPQSPLFLSPLFSSPPPLSLSLFRVAYREVCLCVSGSPSSSSVPAVRIEISFFVAAFLRLLLLLPFSRRDNSSSIATSSTRRPPAFHPSTLDRSLLIAERPCTFLAPLFAFFSPGAKLRRRLRPAVHS